MKKILSLFVLAITLILTLGFASACKCSDGYFTAAHPYHEQCDDGNRLNGDGCSYGSSDYDYNGCKIELGWECNNIIRNPRGNPSNPESICHTICGDGLVKGNESCDDGNLISGDGCTANCTTDVPTVPEFGLIAGITTVLGALGMFFFVRGRK